MEPTAAVNLQDIGREPFNALEVLDTFTMQGIDTMRGLVELGGPIVSFLLALSMFALALIVFKIGQFLVLGVGRRKTAEFAVTAWLAGQREEAYDLAARGNSPLGIVLAHVMRGITLPGSTDAVVREDVERVMITQLARLRAYVRPIEIIGQVAPLVGLFGTVVGMIEAFRQMQLAGTAVDPSNLAGGIWVALITTAIGLAIAIPSAFVASWLEEAIDRERTAMEQLATALFTGRVTDTAREADTQGATAQPAAPAHAH